MSVAHRSVKIPKGLKPGNYLIRHEIIMIELFPPQHYPECAQLTVSGGGDKLPGDEYLVAFPGAYSYDGKLPNHTYMVTMLDFADRVIRTGTGHCRRRVLAKGTQYIRKYWCGRQ